MILADSRPLPLPQVMEAVLPAAVGSVVVIRRSGKDGGRYPLAKSRATIGRSVPPVRVSSPAPL